MHTPTCGPGSVVGIATGYGLDSPGIESRWGRDFPHLFRPALVPTQSLIHWVPGLFPGVKSCRGVTLTPHPFYCRGQERVELYLYSPCGPYARYRASVPVQRCTLPLPYPPPCAFGAENFRNIQLLCLGLEQGTEELHSEIQCGNLLELPTCKTKERNGSWKVGHNFVVEKEWSWLRFVPNSGLWPYRYRTISFFGYDDSYLQQTLRE